MNMWSPFALAGMMMLCASIAATAADPEPDSSLGNSQTVAADGVLSLMGCSEILSKERRPTLTITCDEDKVIAAMPFLKTMGLINPEVTQTAINLMPVTLTGVVMMEAATVAIPATYRDHQPINDLRVAEVIESIDSYGNTAPHLAVSFGFDRALFARINWEHLGASDLLKITHHPALTAWYAATAAAEVAGGSQ